jgi:hypothetical protein
MNVLNIIGYSLSYSATLRVLYASLPDAPPVPVYVDRSGGDLSINLQAFITIRWDEPVESGGIEILGYLINMS